MSKYQANLMTDIVREAVSKCADNVDFGSQVLGTDFEGLFGGVVRWRVMKLMTAYRNDRRFPIEKIFGTLEVCKDEFCARVDDAIYEAIEAAETSFSESLEQLEGLLLSMVEDDCADSGSVVRAS